MGKYSQSIKPAAFNYTKTVVVPEGCRAVHYSDKQGAPYSIVLNPSQTEVYSKFVDEKIKFVGYGGGVRSGKSYLGCVLAMKWSEWAGNVGLVCRSTYHEIESIIYHELLRKYFLEPLFGDKYKYDALHHTVFLPNGSQIVFQSLRNSSGNAIDLNKALMGRGLGWFWIDQSEMSSESNFNTLIHRLSLKDVPERHGYVNFNPRGHDWNYKVFINPSTRRPDSTFIQAKTEDNKDNLAEDYVDMVTKTMHGSWKDRWIDGKFTQWEGLIYPMWNEEVHVVPPLDHLPPDYKVYVSIDHGYNNPVAIGFYTVMKDNIILQFDEYYERGKLIKEYYMGAMKILKEKWGLPKITGYVVMDPTAWKTNYDGTNIEDIFREMSEQNQFNLIPYKGNNEKIAGLNRVGSYLAMDPELMNPFTRIKGSPRFFVTENCEKTRWEFGQYHWKKSPDLNVDIDAGTDFDNLPEEPANKNNHAMDALRYFLMSRPPAHVEVDVRSFSPQRKYFQPLYEATNY